MNSAERAQWVWDQLLARGWIEDKALGNVMAAYHGIFGKDARWPSRRVPPTYNAGIPVRAVIAENCPKLNAWLWKQDKAYLQTPAGEDRVIRLLSTRDFVKSTDVAAEMRSTLARARRQWKAGRIGLAKSRRATNWQHEWDYVK